MNKPIPFSHMAASEITRLFFKMYTSIFPHLGAAMS